MRPSNSRMYNTCKFEGDLISFGEPGSTGKRCYYKTASQHSDIRTNFIVSSQPRPPLVLHLLRSFPLSPPPKKKIRGKKVFSSTSYYNMLSETRIFHDACVSWELSNDTNA